MSLFFAVAVLIIVVIAVLVSIWIEKRRLQEIEAANQAEKKKILESEAANQAEKMRLQEVEAEKTRLKELELSQPIEVMKAGFIAGNEIVTASGDFAKILTSMDPVENDAPQCRWQVSILIGEGQSARSVLLDLVPFVNKSEYEHSRIGPVFIATYRTTRLIYYRDTLFWLSRPCNNELESEDALFRAHKIIHDEFLEPVGRLVNQHIVTLALKWDQTIYKDDYGNYLFDRWQRERDYFFDNVLRKDKQIATSLTFPQRQSWAEEIITDAIFEYKAAQLESNPHLSINVDNLNPVEFEHYCAGILKNCGWNVRVTPASGDQGIDLIANRGNVKAVFQCKKYSQPVGNGAVQEIIAGKQFEQANVAAVVSNSTYTQSAKQLANTTGVHLLHFTELERFAEMAGVA